MCTVDSAKTNLESLYTESHALEFCGTQNGNHQQSVVTISRASFILFYGPTHNGLGKMKVNGSGSEKL